MLITKLIIDKLLHKDVPVFLVKILVYWSLTKKCLYGGVTLAQTNFMSRMESNRVVYCLRLCYSNIIQLFGCTPRLNVYMNNLSVTLNQFGIDGSLGDSLVNHICYADDLCLITLSSSGMPHLLDVCSVYATNHQLSYNATKSFSLCFKPNRIKIKPPDFAFEKKVIPSVDKCKYLGIIIIISVKNCDADLKKQMRKYYANANMLLRKFSYCSPDVQWAQKKS